MKKDIYLWGTGKLATQVLSELKDYIIEKYDVKGVIDNKLSDTTFFGFDVYSPSVLRDYGNEDIMILTWAYDDIKNQILFEYKVPEYAIHNKYFFYEQIISSRYADTEDKEIKTVLGFIKKHGARFINYEYVYEYDNLKVEMDYDEMCNMFYVMHDEKRMYISRKYTEKAKIEDYYRGLCIEQDERSPHRYLSDSFNVDNDSIVVDAGVAEGNFALDIIDRVKRIYLIEADDDWIDALKMTFKDYKDKVVIVKKYLSSVTDGIYTSLDRIVNEPIDFLKMDIEGNEWEALTAAKRTIVSSPNLKIAACVYHTDWDEHLVRDELIHYGFEVSTTSGYLWFPYYASNRQVSTKLHRGIIRAVKRG